MSDSPFRVRGVIEGFYGVYYTWPERSDLIQFMGRHDYNLYIYAPKDDWHHRQRWWQPYPPEIARSFAALIDTAHAANVTFCYALHCSLPPAMTRDQAIQAIGAKLHTLYNCGVRDFSLLFDDLDLSAVADPADLPRVAATLHAELCNGVYDRLRQHDPRCTLSMCPTDYHGRAPFSGYVHTLGALLDPAIAMFYTGPEICSPTISAEDAATFGQAARRKPLIWDNYPVNDLAMQAELHLAPIRSRAADLAQFVDGVVINPMLQAEASKIALLTYAAYLADPQRYEPERAWAESLRIIAGEPSVAALRHLAAYTDISCLGTSAPQPITENVRAVVLSWHDTQPEASYTARQTLTGDLERLREDCYHLKYRLDNVRLRENILPWILALEAHLALARHALNILDCREQGLGEDRARRQLDQAQRELGPQPKRVLVDALTELVGFVQALPSLDAVQLDSPTVHLPVAALTSAASI